MADLGFHRADGAPGPFALIRIVEDKVKTFDLGAVASLCAGAVRLDEFHRFRAIARLFIRAAQGSGLAGWQRRVDRCALAIRAATDTADYGVDLVAIALGVIEAAQGEHADAFAEHRAVGIVRERTAIAGRRQRWRLRKAHEHQDVVQRVYAARKHHVRIARAQFVHGDLQGREARGAGCVGDIIAAAKVEPVGDAAGDDVAEETGEGAFLPLGVVVFNPGRDGLNIRFREPVLAEAIDPCRALEASRHMCGEFCSGSHTKNNACPCAIDLAAAVALGIIQRHLGSDQREQLRGIRCLELCRRNAESERVKRDRRQEAAAPAIGLVPGQWIGVVIVFDQPMRFRRVADQVARFEDVAPETGRVAASREDRPHADNRNGFGNALGTGGSSVGHDLLE